MANNTTNSNYDDLKSLIVGTSTKKIDDILNKAANDIMMYKTKDTESGSYIENIKSLITKDNIGKQITGVFSEGQFSSPSSVGQSTRLAKYKSFESIIEYINYCKRALDVLSDNILSPDDITKVSIEIKEKNYSSDESSEVSDITTTIKKLIMSSKLEDFLFEIIYNTLLYGDYFCEITNNKDALISKAILTENSTFKELENLGYIKKSVVELDENRKIEIITDCSLLREEETGKTELDFDSDIVEKESIFETGTVSENKKPFYNQKLNDLKLVFYKPNRIVKLQTEQYPLCLGYLVFPGFSSNIKNNNMFDVEEDMINNICVNILNNVSNQLEIKKDNGNVNDLKDVVRSMIQSNRETLNVRFVPPNRMQHFFSGSVKNYPYGESLLENVEFKSKCLVSLETALTIQRLTNSTEKRKIGIEIGVPRDVKNVIENLKTQFRHRKISLGTMGGVDTIPSMVSTFEDIYIPQRDGKEFVTVDTLPGQADVQSKVEELKYLRDSIVATFGVPPSFIGLEENLSNKNALSEENILFARTIIRHQKYFSKLLQELVVKMLKFVDFNDLIFIMLDCVTVCLATPKNLQYERETRSINDIVSLIESLERIGIPKDYSKKKYLQTIDWNEVEKYIIDNNLEKITKNKEDETSGGYSAF